MTSRIRKAVIPVAGHGTRFLPISKSIPKEMLPIVNRPVIEYIVRELTEAGIDEIIFISSSNKHALENYFDYNDSLDAALKATGKTAELEQSRQVAEMARYVYVRQRELLGNGHALLQAKELIGDEPFAFAYGDDIYDADPPAIAQLMETFANHRASVIGVVEAPRETLNRYGVIDPEPIDAVTFRVKRIVEKPAPAAAPSNLVANGRYIFTPSIFEALESTPPGRGGELWVVDAVQMLLESEPIYARLINGSYHDCGNVIEYLKTVIHFGLKDRMIGDELRAWLEQSVRE